jgi:integrase
MPVYSGRRAGTWRVVIWAKGRPNEYVVEGKKKEAESFEARKRLELDAGQMSIRVSPSFADFCTEKYAPHAVKHLRGSTWGKVRVYQIATLSKFFGTMKLSEIAVEHVEEYKRARDVGPSSVNNELRVFQTVLNWARTLGHHVATFKVKKLTVRGQGRVRVWNVEQVGRLYDAARAVAPDLLPVLVFLVNTGCRKGEAIAAEWDWIDFAGGMIRIPSNDAWRPKNGMPREVPLSNAVRAALSGTRRHPQWVFPTRHGGRYAEFPKDVYGKVRAAARVVGGPHTARHTYASHFLQAVPDMFLLAQVLGHSHERITALYSHLLPDHLNRARNAVDIGPTLVSMATTMATKTGAQ